MLIKDTFKDNILSRLNKDKVDYYELSEYIIRKCNNKYFKENHKQTVIKLLPTLMDGMSKDKLFYNKNYFITECLKYLIDSNEFKDIFINSIAKINNDNNPKIIDNILIILKKLILNEDDIKKIIDNILLTNIKLEYVTIVGLYDLVNNRYSILKDYMLNTYIINNNTMYNIILLVENMHLNKEVIYNNIKTILNNSDNIDLFELKDIVIDNKYACLKIKNKIDEDGLYNIDKLIKKKVLNIYKVAKSDEKEFNLVVEVIYMIMEEICHNEGVSISDLTYLGSGSFTNAYSLGDKVIKIGKSRETKSYPNNPYINTMLLRKEFSISDKLSLCVEVSEKVDTKSEITEEELYQLYKKIRNLGLIWLDVAFRNVGRLIKDNKRHWNEELPITDEILELMPYRGSETLKSGDIVVIDNDMIYDENDKNRPIFNTPLQRVFEARYLSELDCSKTAKRR